MKRARPKTESVIQVDDGDGEDADFLDQLAQAEAHAISHFDSIKRHRNITAVPASTAPSVIKEEKKEEEGAYIAALRGRSNFPFQQNRTRARNLSGGAACGAVGGGRVVDLDGSDKASVMVEEKSCPCGLGVCVVLTSNTERNPGRKFYKCPGRLENGGCGFFQWCDDNNDSGRSAASNRSIMGQAGEADDLPCPCGAGSCLVLTAKTGNNIGQQFYKCPARASSCGFFKWCNDSNVPASLPASGPKVYSNSNINDPSNRGYGVKTGSTCFKCGKEGHWAKDCPTVCCSSVEPGGRATSSGTCYKCGKTGHWAKDCTSSTRYMNVAQKY